jgi:hypothetical protein
LVVVVEATLIPQAHELQALAVAVLLLSVPLLVDQQRV